MAINPRKNHLKERRSKIGTLDNAKADFKWESFSEKVLLFSKYLTRIVSLKNSGTKRLFYSLTKSIREDVIEVARLSTVL